MARPESREEYRKAVTEAFLRALEEDGLGWKKMWTSGAETPVNGVTGREYSGINRFWLSLTAAGNGWNDPRWVTMTQIMDRQNRYHKGKSWHLQKGSKATYVEYWYRYDCAAGRTVTWQEYSAMIASGRDPDEFRLVPRYTAVFNACQIDGIDPYERPQLTEAWQDELIDDIAAGLGVSITYDGGDSAFYSPETDSIHLPEKGMFTSEEALNAVTLHELAHSTGHPARLGRVMRGDYGRENYAYEELVAEIASAFVSYSLASEMSDWMMESHKAYVKAWIAVLREQPDTLMRAVRDAQRAADLMESCRERIPELVFPEQDRAPVAVLQL
jgi:antirestriction protein ArdC